MHSPSVSLDYRDLHPADFQQLLGRQPRQDVKAFSAETVDNVLDQLHCTTVRDVVEDVLWIAERNKAFREGSHGGLRTVAIDGWESFASYDRCCDACLERRVRVKDPATGELQERIQYHHNYVVAMLVGPVLDVVLDIEPVRSGEVRREAGEDAHHEGELTAAQRLIDRLQATYGAFIDAFVFDALYANGPIMTKIEQHGYGAFIVLKKETDEPLKEALALFAGQPPCDQYEDPESHEHVAFWDVDGLDTLSTFKGKVRVIRALLTRQDQSQSTWCFAVVGDRARRIGRRAAFKTVRSRWHIEDTAFNQWTQYWNLNHNFHHTPNATLAVLLLWSLVFNLLQLFVYRRLGRRRDPVDPTDTIRHIVEMMSRNLGAIPAPLPWATLADTS
jgi:hypothetical protein